MSVAVPDGPSLQPRYEAPARVIRLAPRRADRGPEELIARLRRQIELLSRHYARDVGRLEAENIRLRDAEQHARVVAVRAEERASKADHDARRWRGEVVRATSVAIREAARRERLDAALALPWWAFKRRRDLLSQANPFSA